MKLMRYGMAAILASVCCCGSVQAQYPVGEYFGPSVPFYDSGISGGVNEQMYPYDSQKPWLHGQFQEIPVYGGYTAFRPYNYRHILSQRQTAATWGLGSMPYSQQFWHRYQNNSRMERMTQRVPSTSAPLVAQPRQDFRVTGRTAPSEASGQIRGRAINPAEAEVLIPARTESLPRIPAAAAPRTFAAPPHQALQQAPPILVPR